VSPVTTSQLLVRQALLVGQRQHAVLGKVLEVVVEDDVEGNPSLNQALLQQHGT
jgi:ABC-type branched-subunit amino acid transport system substrate-binding protein